MKDRMFVMPNNKTIVTMSEGRHMNQNNTLETVELMDCYTRMRSIPLTDYSRRMRIPDIHTKLGDVDN